MIGRFLARFLARFSFVLAVAAPLGVVTTAHAQGVRPEVGRPLQQASDALKAKRFSDAMAKVREADGAPNKTANEQSLIDRMKTSVALSSGDVGAMQQLLSGGKLASNQQLPMVQGIANAYYNQRDFGNAAQWYQRYLKEGGTDPSVRTLLVQSYYQAGDCGAVSRSLSGALDDASKAPSEEQLGMLGSCYQRTKDNNGYVTVLEKLATYYPKRQYWADLLSRVQTKKGFAERLQIDVYRLKLASGLLSTPNDYMEMTQMLLGDEYPAEAKKVVDAGYASKVLGTGPDAPRQQRLLDLASKRVAETQATLAKDEKEAADDRDGNRLVSVGYNYVTYGQVPKGIALMEQGIKKGNLRQPEDAKLRLGEAYFLAGQKQKALAAFKTVGGNDGTADLARLWSLQARR